MVFATGTASWGDIFHINGGEEIEVEILADLGNSYQVRTKFGIVDIAKDWIEEIEKRTSPWRLYEKMQAACSDTAEAHFDLAAWCHRRGLITEHLAELEAVIKLDPDHLKARRMLGYVEEAGNWVRKASPMVPDPNEVEAKRREREEAEFIRSLTAEWTVKIKAIYRGRLANREARSKKFLKGRDLILAIDDPLAVPGLTRVLSTGNEACRQLLVESLSRFEQDESTLNLVVITLLDPSPDVRKKAAMVLAERKDDRVTDRLRGALKSDEEQVIRNAAAALGVLKARTSVGDLVRVLSTETRGRVLVSRPVMLDDIRLVFVRPTWCRYQWRRIRYAPRTIGVLDWRGSMIGTESHYEIQTISVYRTEVQEALIEITGQNYGFDEDAWLIWWRTESDREVSDERRPSTNQVPLPMLEQGKAFVCSSGVFLFAGLGVIQDNSGGNPTCHADFRAFPDRKGTRPPP